MLIYFDKKVNYEIRSHKQLMAINIMMPENQTNQKTKIVLCVLREVMFIVLGGII